MELKTIGYVTIRNGNISSTDQCAVYNLSENETDYSVDIYGGTLTSNASNAGTISNNKKGRVYVQDGAIIKQSRRKSTFHT